MLSPHHRRALTLSIGLAALLYLGFVLLADQKAVFAALQQVSLPMLLAIFSLSLLNYLLRFWHWQRYVAAFSHTLPLRQHFLYYLAGFTLTVTPSKAGEAVRSLYLHQYRVTYAQSLAALFVVLLVAFGADGAAAVAITLLCRIATLWFAVALGGVAVGVLGIDGKR